jgi:hypothetical protein
VFLFWPQNVVASLLIQIIVGIKTKRNIMSVLKFKNKFKTTDVLMPNNLDAMIRRSGLLNKEVAERKGIRPETVSRHISGALQFTLKDAEEYAIILGCTAQDVLFVQQPTYVFGYLDNSVVNVITPAEKQKAFFLPFPTNETRKIVISRHTEQSKKWANYRMYMFDSAPINKSEVDPNAYMTLSIYMVDGQTKPQFGVIYPEPGGTFSVTSNADSHTQSNHGVVTGVVGEPVNKTSGLNFKWACPIISCILRSDLINVVEKKF